MRPLKKRVGITLDADAVEKIQLLAQEADRSFSSYINLLLREHIAKPEVQKALREMRRE